MTDTDEFRVALAEAVALPDEVRARPGAAGALRARARRRHRVSLAAAATAVPAGLVLVLVIAALLGSGGSDGRRATTPATGETGASIEPGPRTLSTPIEIAPVLEEHRLCPDDASGTVPAAGGTACYRLGATALTLRRLEDLGTSPMMTPEGTVIDGAFLLVSMTSEDSAAFRTLTAASVAKQLAMVVDGRVWSAPTVAMPIRGGQLQIGVGPDQVQELTRALTG